MPPNIALHPEGLNRFVVIDATRTIYAGDGPEQAIAAAFREPLVLAQLECDDVGERCRFVVTTGVDLRTGEVAKTERVWRVIR